ncbi:MAG TPA: LuxR C-terminal-related transcriptional regulator [Tepidiformaceae bacterium]|nr:LuxR C-terminal-related transcriptional regulator [Tepidiformaceae bacterium]
MLTGQTTRHRHPRGRPPPPDVLTPAEWAVLRAVQRGVNNAQIAHVRGSRPDTVKGQVASIVGKLRLTDRDALHAGRVSRSMMTLELTKNATM